MSRHDPDMLKRITGVAEKWLRRCNRQPPEGKLTDAATLRLILAMSDAVAANSDNVITWRANGRTFTAEPVPDETECGRTDR